MHVVWQRHSFDCHIQYNILYIVYEQVHVRPENQKEKKERATTKFNGAISVGND